MVSLTAIQAPGKPNSAQRDIPVQTALATIGEVLNGSSAEILNVSFFTETTMLRLL